LHQPGQIKPEDKIMAAGKRFQLEKEASGGRALGKSLPRIWLALWISGMKGIVRTSNEPIGLNPASVRDKEKLQGIEVALEKLREGTYGVCEECGDEIGGGRLE